MSNQSNNPNTSGAPRFGGRPVQQTANTQPSNPPASGNPPAATNPAPAKPASSFPASLRSRLGTSTLDWVIVPVVNTLVRFDLNGLGDPFHRLLGMNLTVEYGDYKAAVRAMEAGGEMVDSLENRLNEAWQTYQLQGAMLLFPWRDEVKAAISARPTTDHPMSAPSEDEQMFGEAAEERDKHQDDTPVCLRAIDLLLVINVLARARSQILLANASIAFERTYLERSLVSDDPRLVALARATGYVEETLTK